MPTTTVVYTNRPDSVSGPLSLRRGGVSRFVLPDLQGHARQLTDSAGVVTDTLTADAWGVQKATSGATVNPYKAFGRWGYFTDTPSRLYVRARHLRVDLGRWVSRDPVNLSYQSYYILVENKPTVLFDPSGLQTISECIRKQPRAFCFDCLYKLYAQNAGKWHFCPMKACERARAICGTHNYCGPCGPHGALPFTGGCSYGDLEKYANWLRGLSGNNSCGRIDGADKLAHCWAACMVRSCWDETGRCMWLLHQWFSGENDPKDVEAENIGLSCRFARGETDHLKCLNCCAKYTYDMECW